MTHLAKRNNILHILNFEKGATSMLILLYGFLLRQVLKEEHPTATFLRKINPLFPHQLNDPELFELVKIYQVCTHSRTYGEYNKNECCPS